MKVVMLLASLLVGAAALEVIHQQPLTSRDKQAVGAALTKALKQMQSHGGSKWEACADMFPNGQPPADQNSATWMSCKSEFYQYAGASLVQGPLSSSDKQAVGAALTKALQAMQNHAGGGKWAACTSMFPNGQPPTDQNSATWMSCKSEFLNYAAASLLQGPLSSSDKQAVGEALTQALNAMQNHAGSKYGACSGMFPDGKPPADASSSPTWAACKSQFYAYAAACLVGTKSVTKKGKTSLLLSKSAVNGPLSSSDKKAVGEALSQALNAMQNHAGSRYGACSGMFPDGKPPADASSSPTWAACKSQFYAYAAASLVQGPLSSSDKQAVGEALTKALKSLQGHAGGTKYEACADMYPNGQPPADPSKATWVACKDQFYNHGALVGTKSVVAVSSMSAEDGPAKLPEQGYEGKDVRHQNMKTITKDWGSEYGPTHAPHHSSATRSVVAVTAMATVAVMWM